MLFWQTHKVIFDIIKRWSIIMFDTSLRI